MIVASLQEFKALSFDCYGTLIDWETGIWNALQPALSRAQLSITREKALTDFGQIEPVVEHQHPQLLYRDLLAHVHAALCRHWHIASTSDLDNAFGNSIGDWPVFADTVRALSYLKTHFRLIILSNVDRRSFAATNVKLGVAFDAICTAEDIGSYKPDLRNFHYLLRTLEGLGHKKSELLHVAQSLFHDIEPAERLGLHRCWINRRRDTGSGAGATKALPRMPSLDFRFFTLAELAEAHQAGQ